MNEGQTHPLEWRDGCVPVSARFDDPFYSLDDGLAETRHVFLGGNDLHTRFCPGFHVAELGFGTGLNFLTTLAAFRQSGTPGILRFTSFEAFPLSLADLRAALRPFADLPTGVLVDHYTEPTALPLHQIGDDFELRLIIGDARETLPHWQGRADAWFLDGFSPAKNPEMWEPALLGQVARHTAPQGTFATYTAAGHVRRALAEAGFVVARVPGFGRKRHMTTGCLP